MLLLLAAARSLTRPASLAARAGLNDKGQLGDGTTVDAGEPVAVSTAGTPAAWSKVAAGRYSTCAISADAAVSPGSVWCWGARANCYLYKCECVVHLRARRPRAPLPLRRPF